MKEKCVDGHLLKGPRLGEKTVLGGVKSMMSCSLGRTNRGCGISSTKHPFRNILIPVRKASIYQREN